MFIVGIQEDILILATLNEIYINDYHEIFQVPDKMKIRGSNFYTYL
jgi:hypothetical protein